MTKQDSNGNQILTSSQGWTDTVGRLIPGDTTSPYSPIQLAYGEQSPYYDSENIYPGVPTQDLSKCPAGAVAARSWLVPTPQSATTDYTLCYSAQNISKHSDSPDWPIRDGSYTATFLTTIVLPDLNTWAFTYDAEGTLSRITLPTGGYISYARVSDTGGGYIERTLFDGHTAATTRYTFSVFIDGEGGTLVTDPDGNDTFHRAARFDTSYIDKVYEYQGPYTLRNLLRTSTTTFHADAGYTLPGGVNYMNVVPVEKTVQLAGGALTRTVFEYDNDRVFAYEDPVAETVFVYPIYFGSLLSTTVYDSAGTWQKQSTDFKWRSDPTFETANLLRLPEKETVTSNTCSGPCAQTTYIYSDAVTNTGIMTQHVAVSGPRGNLSEIQRWRNLPTEANLSTSYVVNDTGTVASEKDPTRAHTTTYEYSGDYAGAYRTETTLPGGLSTSGAYEWNSGLLTSFVDANNQTTTYTYDSRFRMTKVEKPLGGITTREFVNSTTIKDQKYIDSTRAIETYSTLDGLGRITQNRLTSDPDGVVSTDTTYDLLGRVSTVSNPYRSTADSTYGITTTKYDALGRVTKVIPPDGTENSNRVLTSYSGDCSTVTDQAGKSRKTCVDGFGRLVSVSENPDGLNYVTQYFYDSLNNLTCVEQHGNGAGSGCSSSPSGDYLSAWRVRRFSYDSLSRLLSTTNPEYGIKPYFGTINYSYTDVNNGLCAGDIAAVCRKTDPRGIVTNYSYDSLSRLIGKTYTDGTPAATFGYDAFIDGVNYGRGRRTSMSVGASGNASSYTFDASGRITEVVRTIDSVAKSAIYSYNADDTVSSITYPSGKTVTYSESTAGRPLGAVDSSNCIKYVTQAHYAPHGALTSLLNGKSSSYITTTNSYNKRLQPDVLSASSPSLTVMSLSYDWKLGTADNGNVYSIQNNRDTPSRPVGSVRFTYDPLNRLETAQSAGTDCSVMQNGLTANWGNSFSYDAWGNLQNKTVTKCSSENLSVTANKKNQLDEYGYDEAGNLQETGYTYDAESRLLTGGGVTFTYDAGGTRVKKSNGKLYWTGIDGSVLAESDLSGAISKEFIYFNGRRTAFLNADTGLPYFYFSDHLGSASVVTTGDGKLIKEESDFYPFGGERAIVDTLANQYKFTGKERDSETGLDYFGARYYGSTMGRFISTDPKQFSRRTLLNPQKWNRYAYVLNNPLILIDPDGLEEYLYIASNVAGKGGADLTAGHSNLIRYNSDTKKTTTYGLWPDAHPGIQQAHLANGSKSDIRTNFAGDDPSHYPLKYGVKLTDSQVATLDAKIAENKEWGYTNTCATWSADTFEDVTGVGIPSSELLGLTDTPRQVGDSITQELSTHPNGGIFPPIGDHGPENAPAGSSQETSQDSSKGKKEVGDHPDPLRQ